MSVRCGNRKVHSGQEAHHASVAQVRLCFSRPDGLPSFEENLLAQEALAEIEAEKAVERFFEEGPHGGTYAGSAEEARDRYFDGLVEQAQERATEEAAEHTVALAPSSPSESPRPSFDEIREIMSRHVGGAGNGYFALEANGKVHFFRVNVSKKGYVSVAEQAGDEYFPRERHDAYRLLRRIAENPEAAGSRYAAEIGACWKCGRTLTDPESRAVGIGPYCQKRA